MKKTILIIGAGQEQIPAYLTAKKMGLNIVATDINPSAPAFQFADVTLIASTRNAEESLSAVKGYASNNKVCGVFTIANDVPLTVATIAEHLGLPSIGVKSATLLSNKLLMKKCFTENKVNTPTHAEVLNENDVNNFTKQHGFPIILKPVDGRGSKGVTHIDEASKIGACYKITTNETREKKCLVEKFIAGKQLSVESIFIKNKHVPIAFADRNYSGQNQFKPFVVENGGVMPSRESPEMISKISKLVEDASSALNVDWGTVKADIVINNNRPSIIELAGRLSGGHLSTFDIPNVYGFDIVEAVIKLCLGLEVKTPDISLGKYGGVCSRYVFSKTSGTIKKFDFPSHQHEGVFTEKFLEPGDHVTSFKESPVQSKAGMIRVLSKNVDTAEMIAENVSSKTVFLV